MMVGRREHESATEAAESSLPAFDSGEGEFCTRVISRNPSADDKLPYEELWIVRITRRSTFVVIVLDRFAILEDLGIRIGAFPSRGFSRASSAEPKIPGLVSNDISSSDAKARKNARQISCFRQKFAPMMCA